MRTVYVCSPYRGDEERNVAKAAGYCLFGVMQGVVPFAPHLFFPQFLDENIPEHRAQGLALGLEMLKRCDELWVFGRRISAGMAAELDAADELGIPVHYYTDRCEPCKGGEALGLRMENTAVQS